MGQKNIADAAHGLEALNEVGQVLGRVDEPVALRVLDEVAVAAEGLGRIKAVVVDPIVERQRKVRHHLAGPVGVERADGARRAAQEGTQGVMSLISGLRLSVNVGEFAAFPEGAARELTTGAAIDAGGVDEEFTRDILAQPFLERPHDESPEVIHPWALPEPLSPITGGDSPVQSFRLGGERSPGIDPGIRPKPGSEPTSFLACDDTLSQHFTSRNNQSGPLRLNCTEKEKRASATWPKPAS
ncbi:hypothetical protein D3C86_1305910 [compost metagenome]